MKKNQFFVSKMTRTWWILIWALKSLKNLHSDWSLSFDLKRKKNLFVVWKMTWRIWQIFIRTLSKCQNWHFHGILLSKVQNAWARNLQTSYVWWHWVLPFQNWHKEFDKFWLEHLSLKNLHFNGLLLNKLYNFWAKKIQRSYISWHYRVMTD